MADWGAYVTGCLGSCRLAGLAFLFSVGILLQILVFFFYQHFFVSLFFLLQLVVLSGKFDGYNKVFKSGLQTADLSV